MNMFLRIITFLVLCGLCASQAPVNDADSSFCRGGLLAKAEYDHSKIISREIDTISTMFDIIKVHASKSSKNIIKRVVNDNLNRMRGYQTTWKESLKHLVHVSELINENNSIPYCDIIIDLVNEWRRENSIRERFINWTSKTYDTIYDCVKTGDSSCSDIDWMIYALKDIDAAEYADDVTKFRSMHPQLVSEYSDSRQQFSVFYSMIIWFRTLKLSNIDFDDDTNTWLFGQFDLIDAAMLGTAFEIRGVSKDIQAIGSLIKDVNAELRVISEVLEYLPTIKSRLQQTKIVFSFLETKVRKMKKYTAPLWGQEFSDFSNSFDEEYPDEDNSDAQVQDKHKIPSEYTLRANIESSFSALVLSAAIASTGQSDIDTEYDNDDRPIASCFKSLNAMAHKFNVDWTSSLQCFRETLDDMRHLALRKIWKHHTKFPDEDLGAIYDVLSLNYKALTAANKYFVELRQNQDAFKDYLDASIEEDDSFFTGASPSDDDIATFINVLDLLSPVLTQFLDIQCKTHKSAVYAELILNYISDWGGSTLESAEGVPIDNLITWINQYYTSTNIGLFYQRFDELISLYDEAYHVFHEYDHKKSRATKMSGILERLNRQKTALSDMATDANPFYEAATCTGRGLVLDNVIIPDIMPNEFGDFFRLIEPLFTSGYLNPGSGRDVMGDIFDDTVEYPARLELLDENTKAVRYHAYQHNKLQVFTLGDSVDLFPVERCREHCTYIIRFNDLRDAKVAAGCYYKRYGTFYQTRDPVTADKLSVLIIQSGDSMSVDVVFLDQYNKLFKQTISIGRPCRVHFAIQGRPSISHEKVTAAIVDTPTFVPESARYNVYSGRTASRFVKLFYVTKGVYLPKESSPWSSITQTISFLRTGGCRAIGVVRETVNEFGKIELRGLMYDGHDVVYNLHSACENRVTQSERVVQVDNEDEVLYMFYRARPVEDSNKFRIVVKFFSNKTTEAFTYKRTEDSEYVLSYVTRHRDYKNDTVGPIPLDEAPQNVPSKFEVLCSDEAAPCPRNQNCDDGDSCIEGCENEYKFGVCKDVSFADNPIHDQLLDGP